VSTESNKLLIKKELQKRNRKKLNQYSLVKEAGQEDSFCGVGQTFRLVFVCVWAYTLAAGLSSDHCHKLTSGKKDQNIIIIFSYLLKN
jgi:hypothetical protein